MGLCGREETERTGQAQGVGARNVPERIVMIGFILLHWQKVLVGLIMMSLAIWITVLEVKLGHARGEAAELRGTVSELQGEISKWQSVYAVLRDEVAKQNEAVEKFKSQAKLASQKAAEAQKRAKSISEAGQKGIASLRAQKGDSCGDALKQIRETLK